MELTWIRPLHGSAAIIAKTVVKTLDGLSKMLKQAKEQQQTKTNLSIKLSYNSCELPSSPPSLDPSYQAI
jgi:hypothetical protein